MYYDLVKIFTYFLQWACGVLATCLYNVASEEEEAYRGATRGGIRAGC